MRRRASLGLSALLVATALCGLLAASAAATNYQHPFEEVFGPTEQPSFRWPKGIAVDHTTGDVLVFDEGQSERQKVSFTGFADGDQFTLADLPAACSASSTKAIEYTTALEPSTEPVIRSLVQAALEEKCGKNLRASIGSDPAVFSINFEGALEEAAQPLLSCAVVVGHGSGTCASETIEAAKATGVYRYHDDGTPAPFAELGSNAIDGREGPGKKACAEEPASCDKTPQGKLKAQGGVKLAIDESSGPTAGDIYITQEAKTVVDVFSSTGKYLGQLTTGKAGTLSTLYGIAVDSSGALYVAAEFRAGLTIVKGIGKYVPAANPPVNADATATFELEQAGLPADESYPGLGEIAAGAGPSAGSLFVVASGQKAGVAIFKMNAATGENHRFAKGYGGEVAVDPATGNAISAEEKIVTEFDGSAEVVTEPLSRLIREEGFTSSAGAGSGGIYVTGGPAEPRVFTYGPAAITPTVGVEAASEVTTSSATLNGTVDASGVEVSECRFEARQAGTPRNEAQKVVLSGATGGSFTLSFEGQTTAPIPYGATDAEVQAALEALATIGLGNVSVFASAGTYYVSFKGALAETNVPQLEADAAALTPSGAAIAVSTSTQGHQGWGNAFIAPCEGEVPTDSEAHPVTGKVTGLLPNKVEYLFRLVAVNANGTEKAEGTFLTGATVQTDPAEVTGTQTATLKATVHPEGLQYGECVFEYGLTSNQASYEHTVPCEPEAALIPPDSAAHEVKAEIAGLQEATTYRFRIKATDPSETHEGNEETFETFGPPKIEALRASGASQDEATLEAEIDPSGFDTSYRFEWGPTAAYGHVAPASFEPIGSGTAVKRVSATLSGLSGASTYHYRLLAESAAGEIQSAEQTLETLNSCGLPEGRCLEMASPREPGPAAQVGRYLGGIEMKFQASEEPGSLAYVVEAGFPDATRGTELIYRATRSDGGWSSTQVNPPMIARDEQSGGGSSPTQILGFDRDLECGVYGSLQPVAGDPPGARQILEAGGGNLYRKNPDGSSTLITVQPPEAPGAVAQTLGGEFELIGMSSHCQKVVFATKQHYPGTGGVGSTRLYEWEAGSPLRNLARVPTEGGGEEAAEETGGSARLNAVSEDGSRVFFSATRKAGKVSGEVGKRGVFVREGGTSSLDVSATETAVADSGAEYQGANRDGTRVYFTANAGLTAATSPEGTDLYEYDFEKPAGARLTDLSATSRAGGARVGGAPTGALVGFAEDGSRAYFIARGQLDPGQGPSLAENEAAGTYSLYERSEAGTRFVARVNKAGGVTVGNQQEATSRVSPDGRYLLFESQAKATAYDSAGAAEAYLYDAEAGPGEAAVTCVSCRQDGGSAAQVGGGGPLRAGGQANRRYQPQSLVIRSARPLVFFRSHDALAPGAIAGIWNLYEWSHGQVFHVASEDATYAAPGVEGLVVFAGASAEGRDLYFFGDGPLNWEDPEGRPAAWDARIGGGFAEPLAPQACDPSAEGSCQGAAAQAPSTPGAGSATFQGSGNPKPKAQKHKKKRHKKKHRKHRSKARHHKKARRHGNGRAGK